MPCHYPEGREEDWCERHRADVALLRALREEPSPPTRAARAMA